MNGPEPDAILDVFRREAALTPTDLWLRYFALGGNATQARVAEYLIGTKQPARADYNLLAQALNERFQELGRGSPVPYMDPR